MPAREMTRTPIIAARLYILSSSLAVVHRLSQATGVGWPSFSPARMCPRSTRTPPGARDEQGRQWPRMWRSRRGRVSERAARASAQLFQDLLDVERCQRDFDPAVLGTPLQGVIAGDRLEGPIADGRKILAVDAGSLQEPEHRRRPLRGELPVGREPLAERGADRQRNRIAFDSGLLVRHPQEHLADFGQHFLALWLDLCLARIEENLFHQLHGEFVPDLRDLDLALRDLTLKVFDQTVIGAFQAGDLGVLLLGRLGRSLFRLGEPVVDLGDLTLQRRLSSLEIGRLLLEIGRLLGERRDLRLSTRDLLALAVDLRFEGQDVAL